jgi:hypothetical protein
VLLLWVGWEGGVGCGVCGCEGGYVRVWGYGWVVCMKAMRQASNSRGAGWRKVDKASQPGTVGEL